MTETAAPTGILIEAEDFASLTGHDHDMTSHPPTRKFVAVPA